jgi:tetratricopeptide (TPR) repeat protein
MVLVKLFKTKGVLHGILGILSCSLYPFIWGWIKHKELQLTKIMAIWTGTWVLSWAIPLYMISTGAFMVLDVLKSQKMQPPPRIVQKQVKRPSVKAQPKTQPKAQPKVVTQKPTFEMKLTSLNNLIKLDETNADAFYNRGWLYVYKGDLQMAEKDYTKAIENKKRYVDAYYNRGLVYVKMKRYEQAIKDFSEVIKLKPNEVDAYCNRGNANFQLGKTDLALQDYIAALKIDPKDADLFYNRAVVYLAKGQKDKSQADFQKAAQLGHNKAKKYLGIATKKPKT